MANPKIIVDFVANLSGLTKAAGEVEKTGKSASKGLDWKGVAKWTASAAAVGGATKFLVDATKGTAALAKSTMALQRATGLDTKTASEWVLLLQQRGIEVGTFTKSLTKMDQQMALFVSKGGKGNPLTDLGVSVEAIRSNDPARVLLEVADGFQKIQNPAQKAVLAQKLFGKQGQALLPILSQGSAGVQKLLGATDKYGAALSGESLKATQDQIKAQRELDDMHKGLSNTIGSAVLPVQAELLGTVVGILGPTTKLLEQYSLMGPVVIALGVAYVGLKAAQLASSVAAGKDLIVTIAQATWKGVQAAATAVATAAQWAYNAAMIAGLGPILLVVAAVAALIAIGVLVWKNWDAISAGLSAAFAKIKAAAVAVWNWIKANWPLLLAILTGPIGLAVLVLARYWSTITAGVRSAVSTVKSLWSDLTSWIGGKLSTIGGYLDTAKAKFAAIGSAAHDAVSSVKSAISDLISWLGKKVDDVASAAGKIASALKAPINSFIGAWNGLTLRLPSINVPKLSIPGTDKSIGGGSWGGQSFPFPDIPKLARGGVIDRATLALVGEGRGREVVAPEALLREIAAEGGGDSFTLNLYVRDADPSTIAYGFRRLELLRTGR